MLTHPRLRGMLIVGAAALLAVGSVGSASADLVCEWVDVGEDELRYVCTEPGSPGTPGGPRPGGTAPPPCDLTQSPYNEFCEGTSACWGNNPAAVQEPRELEGVPQPSEDAHVAYKSCRREDGSTYDEWYWATEPNPGPTPAEAAAQAFGQLATPAFQASFNPETRTLVNLDTWWWAEGATTGEIVGTGALGVRAVGTPDRIEVDPGDGTGTFTCDFVTTQSDACSHVYRRASRPTYDAQMRLVYTVRFERNGNPMDLPGLPTQLESPWVGTVVDVDEVQSIVRP
ncbi:hypothetical protein [Nocardioides massiliensis]|uniref:Uncharacterized protein n=1 Tax=Nocardioides massiliensis TaxID=1325935 RepID=A0ABT9NJL0_9ACTN|nr:hypothetical protein [Nocardioides massiliensis]MDP9820593.1 hypothetical protein [Nocardioides massiliensis]